MSTCTRVLLFDQAGQQLAEVDAGLPEGVSWRLNAFGSARVVLPLSDPKCTPALLGAGNRILIRFSDGLPDWGGVLDLERRRSSSQVSLLARSAEYLLGWRVTGRNRTFTASTAGAIFAGLLDEENGESATGIEKGTVYEGGTARAAAYHHHDLYAQITRLAALSGQDFDVSPTYAAGRLSFAGNWYEQRGTDKTDTVLLSEGRNVGRVEVIEGGPIANRVILDGAGTLWDASRIESVDDDADSAAVYGFREYAEAQPVADQTTLDANAAEILSIRAWPRTRLVLDGCTNEDPAGFADYDIGDIVTVQALEHRPAWAVDLACRVVGRTWQPGGCRVEVEEWRG